MADPNAKKDQGATSIPTGKDKSKADSQVEAAMEMRPEQMDEK